MKSNPWVWVGTLVAISVAVVGGLFAVDHWRGGSTDDQSGYVKVACRDWVKDRLTSPATAKFSGESVSRTGNTYVVTGSVDSQNSFGAMIRNGYQCEAINDGSGSSSLVSLTGLDN